uniref:Uncharacterized protein n=1 Tax=Ditylenchus dipsaci TaxID=166011 RepID=A0A915D7Y7_9BILA
MKFFQLASDSPFAKHLLFELELAAFPPIDLALPDAVFAATAFDLTLAGQGDWEQGKVDEFADFHKDVISKFYGIVDPVEKEISPETVSKVQKAVEEVFPFYVRQVETSDSGFRSRPSHGRTFLWLIYLKHSHELFQPSGPDIPNCKNTFKKCRACHNLRSGIMARIFKLLIFATLLSSCLAKKDPSEYEDETTDLEEQNSKLRKPFTYFKTEHPTFKQWPMMSDVDCGRVVGGDKQYIKLKAQKRIKYVDDLQLATDCASIKERNYFATEPNSVEEKDFPIAFSKAVFKDYLFIESELAAGYTPQNWYCFSLDSKSDKSFQKRIERVLSMDSLGHNQTTAHYECMRQLALPERQWKYLMTVQNSDVQLKTNQELVQIFKWMGGANDIEICKLPLGRVKLNLDWTFDGLDLFPNETRSLDAQGRPLRLRFAKGYLESSLSREFVDFMVYKINVQKMLVKLDKGKEYVDEIFLQTIAATDELEAPGGFTHGCIDRRVHAPYLTVINFRFNIWFANNTRCYSKRSRHALCVFGMEDLAPNFLKSYSLLANKMSPKFDFGAIRCWHEEMHNRTYFRRGMEHLQPHIYQQLPQVRFHMEKTRLGKVDINQFDCRYPYADEFAFLDVKLFHPTPMEPNE